jgi:hypothetical protein
MDYTHLQSFCIAKETANSSKGLPTENVGDVCNYSSHKVNINSKNI